MATKQNVQKVESNVPDYIKQGQARGSENVGTEDVTIPRIDIIQAIGPQLNKSKPEFIEGASAGDLFNTLTGQTFADGVSIVLVSFYKQFLVWEDKDKGNGGLQGVFASLGEAEAKASQNELWEAVETPTHIAILLDENGESQGEVAIPMAKSKYRISKKLNSLARLNGGDRFSRVYRLSSIDDQNAEGKDFKNFAVANAEPGWPSEDVYREAETLYEAIASGARNVKYDTEPTAEQPPAESEI